ncbi:MAG: NAD(+) diphosphatase [Burkholderiaceae bacterium]
MQFVPAVQAPASSTEQAWSLAFFEGRLLLPQDEVSSLQPSHPSAFLVAASARHYLGRLDGIDCWALRVAEPPAGWRAVPLRAAMMNLPAPLSAVAGRASQVLEWDRTHRFCGACGTPTELHVSDRARSCPACKHVAYPRVTPAMMTLVWRGRELLLARSPHYAPGIFSALAGFVEAGESLEDCIHREVAEEVGVQVADLRYYGSQSWPFPNSLMVAYTARWVSGEIVPQAAEIEAAFWYDIDALPGIPPRFSISGHLIRDTVRLLRDTAL